MTLQRQAACILLFFLLGFCSAYAASRIDIPVHYYKLENGLRVVISEDHSAPVVAVAVYYNTGFRVEPKGQTGFAHLFEHMMFQETENLKKFEFTKYIEGAGGFLNGSTRFDFTNYYEMLPANRVETALWLEADRMQNLKITEENLRNQKDVVMEEVRVNMLNQPYALFQWIDLWQYANQNWYNAHNFYGDLTDLEKATVPMAKEFFDTYYAPNNAALVVTGDVEVDEVKAMIEKHFAPIPSREQPPVPDLTEPPQEKEKRIEQKDKLARLPAIAIGYHMPPQDSPDFPALVLLNMILEGDPGSRLYQRLVKEKQLCLDWSGAIHWGLGNEFDYLGPMLLTMSGVYKEGVNADDIIRSIDEVLAGIKSDGVSSKELEDARTLFRSNYYDQVEGHISRSDLLAALALFRDDPAQINTALEPFLRVTPDQVKAAASKYLVPSNRTVIDRVPEAGGES